MHTQLIVSHELWDIFAGSSPHERNWQNQMHSKFGIVSPADWRNAMQGFSGLPITWTGSTNQNVTNGVPRKNPEQWPPCLAHKLKRSNRAKDWWISEKEKKKYWHTLLVEKSNDIRTWSKKVTTHMEISAEKTKLMKTTPAASTQRSKWMDRNLRQSQASNTWAQL